MLSHDRLTYRIEPAAQGWAWRTMEPGGRVVEAGVVETRALAAACVIRSIARALEPEQARAA